MSNLLPFPPDVAKDHREFDVSDVIHEVCDSLESSELRRGIFLDVDAPPYTMIRGNRRHLKQLLHALISNAMQVTPRGGSVVITTISGEDVVELEIADSGEGLRSEVSSDVGDSGAEPFQGWSEIRKIVAEHGARILVSECPDGGAAFTLRIPRSSRGDASSLKAA